MISLIPAVAVACFFCAGPFSWWVVRARPRGEWTALLMIAALAGFAPGLAAFVYAMANKDRDLLRVCMMAAIWAAAWAFAASRHLEDIAGE